MFPKAPELSDVLAHHVRKLISPPPAEVVGRGTKGFCAERRSNQWPQAVRKLAVRDRETEPHVAFQLRQNFDKLLASFHASQFRQGQLLAAAKLVGLPRATPTRGYIVPPKVTPLSMRRLRHTENRKT